MAQSLGNLLVSLKADDAQLIKGIGRVNKSMDKFGAAANRAKNYLVGFLGAAAVGRMVSNTIALNDRLGKTADKLGIASEKLSGLQLASKLAGVENETLNKGLQNMIRNISDYSHGTGEAASALRSLGLASEDLINLSPDQQFIEIADAINNVSNNTDRLNYIYKIFGGRATELSNVIKGGKDELNKFNDEAKRLGIALSREEIKKMEDVNDQFTRMKLAMQGVNNAMVIFLSPALIKVADGITYTLIPAIGYGIDKFTDFGKYLGGFAAGMVAFAEGDFTRAADIMKMALDDLFKPPDDPLPITIDISKSGGGWFPTEEEMEETARLYKKYLDGVTKKYQEAADARKKIENDLVGNFINLLNVVGAEHKAAAIAAVILTKGMAIAQTLAYTQTAAILAYASQLVPGDVTSPARAELARQRVLAMGAVSAGLIAATGLVEISKIAKGEGGGGGTATPVYNANPVSGLPETQFNRGVTNITVNARPGDTFTSDQIYTLIDQIREATDRGDRIVIDPRSRNAIELRAG